MLDEYIVYEATVMSKEGTKKYIGLTANSLHAPRRARCTEPTIIQTVTLYSTYSYIAYNMYNCKDELAVYIYFFLPGSNDINIKEKKSRYPE